MNIGTLPDGSRGFDANSPVSPRSAERFKDAGYSFAIRYVRRAQRYDYDISEAEKNVILNAGLGLMIVQHVAAPGWTPSGSLGASYGLIAASEAEAAGVPAGVSLWCDLEGVKSGVPHSEVIQYCNSWYSAVKAAGFVPGLYVGDSCGLTSLELYNKLKFASYWSAYNLNRDNYPAVRGVQMRQRAATLEDLIPGYTNQNLDVDIIQADKVGGTPKLVFA